MGDTAQPDVPIMINLPFVEATTPDTTHQSTTSATNAFLELDLTILERIASHLDFHTALSLSTAHSRVRDAAERELGRLVDIEQPLKELFKTRLRDTGCHLPVDAIEFYTDIFSKNPVRATFVKKLTIPWFPDIYEDNDDLDYHDFLEYFPPLISYSHLVIATNAAGGVQVLWRRLMRILPGLYDLKVNHLAVGHGTLIRWNYNIIGEIPLIPQIKRLEISGGNDAAILDSCLLLRSLPSLISFDIVNPSQNSPELRNVLKKYLDQHKPSLEHLGVPLGSLLEHPCLGELKNVRADCFNLDSAVKNDPENWKTLLLQVPAYPKVERIHFNGLWTQHGRFLSA